MINSRALFKCRINKSIFFISKFFEYIKKKKIELNFFDRKIIYNKVKRKIKGKQ